MTETSPRYDAISGSSTRPAWIALAITVAATAVAMLVDSTAYSLLFAPGVYDKDFGRLLRIMGFAGTWVALSLALGLSHDGAAAARAAARVRAWLLLGSALISGALAEVLKILVRRERPQLHDGAYGFRPWDERTWSGSGLAFPSSHTAVAFGGAFMLGRLFPRARWVGYVLAAGCALTRVFARAHFVSDVVFAAGLGWLVSWALWRRWGVRAASLMLAVTLLSPRQVAAQQQPAPPMASSASAAPCTVYVDCAYNLVPRGLGLAVVRGESEVHVASLGFLWPGSLGSAFAGHPEAERLAQRARSMRVTAAAFTDLGLVALAIGTLRAATEGTDDATARAALGIGVASLGISVPLQFRADAWLSRAVWRYNARFDQP